MISTFRLVPLFGSATALWLALGLSPSLANDTCAAGFTPVEGSETCIRIGGHVRVETSKGITTSSISNGWATGGARPASLHSGSDYGSAVTGADFGRSHLRLPQGALGYADQR